MLFKFGVRYGIIPLLIPNFILGRFVLKKVFIILSLISVISASALKSTDLLVYFDEQSGFFSNGALLSYIAAAICLIVIISGGIIFTKKLNKEGDYKEKKNIGFALVSLFAFLGFFYAGYELLNEYTYVENMGISENTALGISMRMPLMILTFLSGLYFIYNAVISFTGKSKYMNFKLPFIPLITVLWSVIFTLFIFMHYSVTTLHSENLFLIFSAVFCSYGFLQYSGFVSGLQKNRLRRLFISALAMVSFSIPYCVSSLIKEVMGISVKHSVPFYVIVVMFCAAWFMASFTVTFSYSQSEKSANTFYRGKRFRKE